jgi:uncharacterized protein
MKTAVLLHGTGGDGNEYFWFKDTKAFLEESGFAVWWPSLPNPDKPNLPDALAYIDECMPELDEESVIIGHSSACALILSILEQRNAQIAKAVLVSGFYKDIGDGLSPLMLQEAYDWQKIRANTSEMYLLNSDNDPWGCDDKQAYSAAQKLGVPLIVMFGEGHMGSSSFNQPYREFPLLKKLLA